MIATILLALLQVPTLRVEAGYGGKCFSEAWVPVSVLVQNDGPAFEAELRLKAVGLGAPFLLRRRVTVPASSRRRIPWKCYVSESIERIEAALVDGDGRVLAKGEADVECVPEVKHRLLEVGVRRTPLRPTREIPAAILTVAPLQFPRSIEALLGLDAVLVSDAVEFDPEQQAALREWLETGGRLITATEVSGFSRDLLPLTPEQSTVLRLPAGKKELDLPIWSGPIRRGSPVHSIGERTSAVRAPAGGGTIVQVLFPMTLPGIEEAVAPGPFWMALLDIPLPPAEPVGQKRKPGRRVYSTHDGLFEFFEAQEQPINVGFPGLAGGLAMIALYVLFIGPVDFRWRRRRETLRQGWTSFAMATAVTTAALLIWGGWFARKADRLRHVVVAGPGRAEVLSMLQAGEGGERRIESDGCVSPYPGRGPDWGGKDSGPVEDERGLTQPLAPLALRRFVTTRPLPPGDLGLRLRWTGPGRLEATNEGRTPLRECVLAVGSTLHRLGDLEAGARQEWTLEEKAAMPLVEWFRGPNPAVPGSWWLEEEDFWRVIGAERHPAALSLYSRVKSSDTRPCILSRRRIDASSGDDPARALFLGFFDRDVTGWTVTPPVPAEVRGVYRVAIDPEGR